MNVECLVQIHLIEQFCTSRIWNRVKFNQKSLYNWFLNRKIYRFSKDIVMIDSLNVMRVKLLNCIGWQRYKRMLSSSNFEGGEEDRNNWILDLGLEIGNENWSYKSIYRSQLNFSTNNYRRLDKIWTTHYLHCIAF